MDKRLEELLERGVVALEALNEDTVINVESGPPVCPHCEQVNPTVRVDESRSEGRLGEFLIQAECLRCHHIFFALPSMWEVVKSLQEANEVNEQRKERLGVHS